MSAIEASSGTYRCRVDGTIVLSVEIEPRFKDAFNALFGTPGTPMAIAALQVGYAAAKDVQIVDTPEKPKGGPLSKLAGVWCQRPEFWEWINSTTHGGIFWHVKDMIDAANFVREICEVSSRAELDHDADAAESFNEVIRGPFMKHMQARGITI